MLEIEGRSLALDNIDISNKQCYTKEGFIKNYDFSGFLKVWRTSWETVDCCYKKLFWIRSISKKNQASVLEPLLLSRVQHCLSEPHGGFFYASYLKFEKCYFSEEFGELHLHCSWQLSVFLNIPDSLADVP